MKKESEKLYTMKLTREEADLINKTREEKAKHCKYEECSYEGCSCTAGHGVGFCKCRIYEDLPCTFFIGRN